MMGTFAADLTKFCKQTAPEAMDAKVRGTLMEIGARLVERSPVGDPSKWTWGDKLRELGWVTEGYVGGRFRSNWQYGFGAAPAGELFQPGAPSYPGAGETVAKLTGQIVGTKVAGVHYLVNNLPYAQAIENGHSTQAPTGIVALTMAEIPGIWAAA